MAEIDDLTIVDASNIARFPEAMAPSAVNDGARALEGIVARWHRDLNSSVTTGGSSTAYTYAANQTLSAYYDGMMLGVDFHTACGATPTIDVDSIGAKDLIWPNGTQLVANDVATNSKALIVYDGAKFQVLSVSRDPATGGATKEFFVYVATKRTGTFPFSGSTNSHTRALLADTETGDFLFHVPNDFTTLTNGVVVIIPDATETIQWDVASSFGADGEQNDANTDSDTDATLAVTNTELSECDVSPALTAIAAGDYVGVSFTSNTTNIRPMMLRIRYS